MYSARKNRMKKLVVCTAAVSAATFLPSFFPVWLPMEMIRADES